MRFSTSLSTDCPAMADFNVIISLERVPLTFIRDSYTAGCPVPTALVDDIIQTVTTMKDADPDSFTDRVLVSFVLHALLRVNHTVNYLELRRELSCVW